MSAQMRIDSSTRLLWFPNYVLRGVPLSAGHHRFELWYAPPYFRWAVGLSALALCCLVVMLAYR